jgi:glycosyltransferase involved in cell wall biosynthesis
MKSIHLNGENAVLYISRGGLEEDVKVISPIVENQILTNETYRNELNLNQKIVLGMHQRRDDKIFSEIPLKAFSNICAEFNIHFIILNGSRKYVEQAEELGIKEITFLPEALTDREKHRFLNTLDIFAHGRFDGETNSVALAEAMEHNLPIVTHLSEKSNGQREQVDLCGFFAHNETEYTEILRELVCNQELLQASSKASQLKFRSVYDLKLQISKIENELVLAYEKTRNKHGRILSYLKNFVKRRKKRFSYLVRKSTFAKRYGAQLNSLKLI